MNSSQIGSILNRVFALDGTQRRTFSDQGRGRPPRPLKRSIRRPIVVNPPVTDSGAEGSSQPQAAGTSTLPPPANHVTTSLLSSSTTRPLSYPLSSTPTASTGRRPRSLYSPEKPGRNSVHDKNASLATTTKTIMSK